MSYYIIKKLEITFIKGIYVFQDFFYQISVSLASFFRLNQSPDMVDMFKLEIWI